MLQKSHIERGIWGVSVYNLKKKKQLCVFRKDISQILRIENSDSVCTFDEVFLINDSLISFSFCNSGSSIRNYRFNSKSHQFRINIPKNYDYAEDFLFSVQINRVNQYLIESTTWA